MSASDAEGAAPHDDTEQQRIAEARVKTGNFIARLMMAYAGFAAFCTGLHLYCLVLTSNLRAPA